jgi:membrane associated rhomboid family serine protease
MVLPLYDHSPFKWPTPPYVTWLLIAINAGIFLLQAGAEPDDAAAIDHMAGLIPAAFSTPGFSGTALPAPLTLITYTFLHANFMHIFGNMLFLWVFGDDVEEAIGHWRFLVFYIACGIGAGAAFVLSDPSSNIDLIGASGSVAGVIAAYLMFRPCAKVTVLVVILPLRLRSFWVIGGWAIYQVIEVANRTNDNIAYWAHVGGLATGAILFVLMRPPGVRLFECVQPETVPTGGHVPPPIPARGHLPPSIPPR